MTITPTLALPLHDDLDGDDELDTDVRWLTFPDRNDEAAVEAWFAAMDLHHAEADARYEADITACEQLVRDVAELLGVDLAARSKARAKARGPVC